MKKSTKVFGIIALIFAAAGIVLIVTGIALGGIKQSREVRFSGEIDIEETYTDVRSLDFDLGLSSVKIEEGDAFSIRGNRLPSNFTSKVKNGIWKIDADYYWMDWIGVGPLEEESTVVITLPKGTVLDSADISVGMGKLELDTLNAGEIELEAGAGEVKADRLTGRIVDLSCGMGKISFGSADVEKSLKAECGMGSIEGEIHGKEDDYSYSIECGMGSVELGSLKWGGFGKEEKQKVKKGSKELKAECGMGSISISFDEK